MYDEVLPNFDGKLLVITTKDGPEYSTLVEQAHFENQGGRLFVVGTARSAWPEPGWQEGLQIALAWDAVHSYYVIDSLEEYRKLVNKFYKR